MTSVQPRQKYMQLIIKIQETLLDCDQSNVLLAHIIFFCILLKAFSFISTGPSRATAESGETFSRGPKNFHVAPLETVSYTHLTLPTNREV